MHEFLQRGQAQFQTLNFQLFLKADEHGTCSSESPLHITDSKCRKEGLAFVHSKPLCKVCKELLGASVVEQLVLQL